MHGAAQSITLLNRLLLDGLGASSLRGRRDARPPVAPILAGLLGLGQGLLVLGLLGAAADDLNFISLDSLGAIV